MGSANILINEIVYDPELSDYYYEWIELYNPTNKSINLSGWSINDNSVKDFLEQDLDHGNGSMIISPFGYALITDHGTKLYNNYSVSNNTIKLYVDDSAIGNGLGNNGDKLILINNQNQTVDSVEWIQNFSDVKGEPAFAVVEGSSLARYSSIDTNNSRIDLFESKLPTPGNKNKIIEEGNTIITCNESYFLIKKNEKLKIHLIIKNAGRFFDNITTKITGISDGWFADIENKISYLETNTSVKQNVTITPCQHNCYKTGKITFLALSEKENSSSDEITLTFEIFAPDLYLKKIKGYNEEGLEINEYYQGEIIRIKAFCKNQGLQNATNVNVNFYLDKIAHSNYLGNKFYENIGKYQKYPSLKIDTQRIPSGNHKIFVVADEKNSIDEFNEENNLLSFDIKIIDTRPTKIEKSLLITDIYYHSRPGLYNEFISVFNPTNSDIDLTSWYLTNEPFEIKTKQRKIEFPNNTIIPAKSKLILSENASSYKWETGKNPDFEYNYDSDETIPQMISSKKFIMSNKGAAIALKNAYNHTVDFVVYENNCSYKEFWKGSPIPFSGQGVVLKRNLNQKGSPIDTNTFKDWVNNRRKGIGQSDFPYVNITFYGEISTFVSPDCSFKAIINELRKANDSIYLNIYEFTSPFLCDEMINALIRGVSVNIFLEGGPIGGIAIEEKYILNRIADYGGNIRFITNDKENKVYARYIFNHGKYLVIDNKTVIVESCNWAKTGIPKDPTYGNREWGIIVRSKDVAEYFLKIFIDDWNPERCDSYSFDKMNLSVSSDFYMDKSVYRGTYEPEFESRTVIGNFSVIPVFSPDTSYDAICDMIDSASNSIYIQQLYIYQDWRKWISPFVERLVNKSNNGVDVKVILNYNPNYEDSNQKNTLTKQFLEENDVEVKIFYTNWSYFSNVHNKGMIVDNKSVLISSINWNENSVTRNREAGIIIENEIITQYYADVFFYDWNLKSPKLKKQEETLPSSGTDYKNTIYIVILFTLTFALIARDWRKRQWT